MPESSAPEKSESPVPIAVFVGSWLPLSETFVYDQIRFQHATRAHVFATSRVKSGSAFPYEHVHVLSPFEHLAYRYWGKASGLHGALNRSGARLAFAHFGLNGALALPFAEQARLPLVVMFHGHDVGGLLPQNRNKIRYARYHRLAPALFNYASLLLCASSELAERLTELGAPAEKLVVHRLGIDPDRFSVPAERGGAGTTRVLMVGRLVEKKGMVYGLRAFAHALASSPTARLHIVGTGPLRGELEREARLLGVTSKVRFLGALPHDAVRAEMQHADVMLTPSVTTASGDRESGVIVLKEAAASGLPSIGTRHGGIPEIIEHEATGLLVEERNVEQLTSALEQLLADAELRQRMGRAARQKMLNEYDNRLVVRELERRLLGLI